MKKGGGKCLRLVICGGDKGVRTPDLVTASHALSQLSYIPESTKRIVPKFLPNGLGNQKMFEQSIKPLALEVGDERLKTIKPNLEVLV